MEDKCIICDKPGIIHTTSEDFRRDIYRFECATCGNYSITRQAKVNFNHWKKSNNGSLYYISGKLREASEQGIPFFITTEKLGNLLDDKLIPDNPLEKIDKILFYVYNKAESDAESIPFNADKDYPVAYAKNTGEFLFYIHKAEALGYLENRKNGCFRLNLAGWKRLGELQRSQPKPDKAFVAMWFDDTIKSVYENGIKPALIEAGYKPPFRVDDTPHNEKTDNKIIEEIRKSSLLVADFTGNRGGVYFEAGFAMGLGIPVIWTCKDEKEHKDNLHFNTNHYNHILWKDVEDLKNQLKNMIVFNFNNSSRY